MNDNHLLPDLITAEQARDLATTVEARRTLGLVRSAAVRGARKLELSEKPSPDTRGQLTELGYKVSDREDRYDSKTDSISAIWTISW